MTTAAVPPEGLPNVGFKWTSADHAFMTGRIVQLLHGGGWRVRPDHDKGGYLNTMTVDYGPRQFRVTVEEITEQELNGVHDA